MPNRRSPALPLLVLLATGCATSPKPTVATKAAVSGEDASIVPAAVTSRQLVGRWLLSPGDCRMPESEAPEPGAALVSPAGQVLTLGEGGDMSSRQGDFIRRGTWKLDQGTLRLAIEPPPRRLDMGFVPSIEPDRLLLQGAEEMLLVYHRDPFVGVDRAP